jgi:hypothetical protein
MKNLALAIFLALIVSICNARPVVFMSYGEMTRSADLIVIATPTAVRNTGRSTEVPGMLMTGRDGKSTAVPAVWVETSFTVLAVLKGEEEIRRFVLSHLRESLPPEIVVNGPKLVRFDPNKKGRFLLFLRREADGRFSPLVGQAEPAMCILDLGGTP